MPETAPRELFLCEDRVPIDSFAALHLRSSSSGILRIKRSTQQTTHPPTYPASLPQAELGAVHSPVQAMHSQADRFWDV